MEQTTIVDAIDNLNVEVPIVPIVEPVPIAVQIAEIDKKKPGRPKKKLLTKMP